jgi:hypothetical protein
LESKLELKEIEIGYMECSMKEFKAIALICALCFFCVCRVEATEACQKLHSATPQALTSYLDGIQANDSNAECVAYAITRLGRQRYEPSAPVLARLLSFRRPATALEKNGFFLHPQSKDEIYPAAGALEEFGVRSAQSVLEVLKSPTSSSTARENAVLVWMFIYRDKPSKGVALLRQETVGAVDPAVKENLRFALGNAVAMCGSKEKARCTAASVIQRTALSLVFTVH